MLDMKSTDGGVLLTVKVVPGSSRTALAGCLNGMLKVKVAAAPEKGKANDCLIDFLAKLTGIKKQQIVIESGHTSPVKLIRIEETEPETLKNKLDIKKNKR